MSVMELSGNLKVIEAEYLNSSSVLGFLFILIFAKVDYRKARDWRGFLGYVLGKLNKLAV